MRAAFSAPSLVSGPGGLGGGRATMIFLTSQPLWVLGILVVLATLLSMAGPVFVRRHVGLARLSTNNEVAGFKFATLGVLYAVLLAFVVIVVWEKFNEAENAVAQEAGAAATVYRLAEGVGGVPGAIAGVLGAYLTLFPTRPVIWRVPAAIVIGAWAVVQFSRGFGTVGQHALAAQGAGIAYFTHIGGFLCGIIAIGLFRRREVAAGAARY